MCGIYGFIDAPPDAGARLARMGDALAHRGPDDRGTYAGEGVFLGHNRLSILDLSRAGHQPMTLPERGLALVFNGEIYNYLELRAELGADRFRTATDSEVLLHAYARWGRACLERLNGMFAFAIWDPAARELFLARDRFGIKPLYVARIGGGFYFASEPKALFAAGLAKRPNLAMWSTYLMYGTYEHSADTFFAGVRQLRPGAWQTVAGDGATRSGRYYDLGERLRGLDPIASEAEVEREYPSLLADAVGLRFRADVPVGIAVSGGLDSSTLIATVADAAPDPARVKAFTYTCGEPCYDEAPHVRELLRDTAHPHLVATLPAPAIADSLAEVAANQEEPFGGFNTLCLAALCRLARDEGVTVLLDGNGLDEAWAGYEYYARADWDAAALASGPVQGAKTPANRPGCLTPEMRALARRPEFDLPLATTLDNLRYRDLIYSKIPRALRFSDRASMMYSREIRVPFLDHRLVEFSFRLSRDLLIRDGCHKFLLRRMTAARLPRSVVQAPKRPLHTPQREWLANELAGMVEDLIFSQGFRALDWFDMTRLQEEWRHFRQTPPDNSFYVWQWLSAALHAAG